MLLCHNSTTNWYEYAQFVRVRNVLHLSLFCSKSYMGTCLLTAMMYLAFDSNSWKLEVSFRNVYVWPTHCLFCRAATMAEKDRHVRVAPTTLHWNLQESAKSAQNLTPRRLFGCGYSSAVRLESQFFSLGFCCPGKFCVQ